MIQGSCDPLQVISLVECGVDMFDASYALHLTNRNAAVDADVLFNIKIGSLDIESEKDDSQEEGGGEEEVRFLRNDILFRKCTTNRLVGMTPEKSTIFSLAVPELV